MISFPRGREVVLGVGAGIAAYKACDVLRRLQDHGFLVTVVPTPSSLNFVGKATWEALSGREVKSEVWEGTQAVSHVALADKADLILIAPATADLIAKLATGRADDLLTTTALATSAKMIVVPAMHPGMYLNPATQSNIETLRSRGITVLEPDYGRLTGADSGIGRFPETTRIIETVLKTAGAHGKLLGKKIVVTAGGTIEPIDPVRYIGNRSSGRQGVAIAHEALREGATVTVIAAQTEEFHLEGAKRINVQTAEQMQSVLNDELLDADALVMAAAVADARPVELAQEKIGKESFERIELTRNPDVLGEAGARKRPSQIFVGFAAETGEGVKSRGLKKLHSKGVDLLYVTDVSGGRVFGELETSGSLLSKRGESWDFESADKFAVGRKIVEEIAREMEGANG